MLSFPGFAVTRRALVAGVLIGGTLCAVPPLARASGQSVGPVRVWLTVTSGTGGRHVVEGLKEQAPVKPGAGSGGTGTVITVNPGRKYQRFVGGGASMTDTAAYLIENKLAPAARQRVMSKLFSPASGIGLDFLRNPMGASDLARYDYSYDTMPAGKTDPSLKHFSVSHDLAGILPLTREARTLRGHLTLMLTPWSAPAWMKTNDRFKGHGALLPRYYQAYARYFVKAIRAYRSRGVPVNYISVQNEPGCCAGATYPTTAWTGGQLDTFTRRYLLPALHQAKLTTRILALDWNWSTYASYGAPALNDKAVRDDPLFGGIAWHGYDSGGAGEQTTVHNRYPHLGAFDTEHSGGSWVSDQQRADMGNIIDYTRNWGQSVVKWSLAVNPDHGPHNGGCGNCSGLVTIGGDGQADYTVEYYDLGQLTKFVQPGAYRIASSSDTAVPDVAWLNPDGSRVLIAYNGAGTPRPVTVRAGGEAFTYTLPARASATFRWNV